MPDELLREARERFEAAADFTVAVEEEFALLEPGSLDLVNRFEEVHAAAQGTALEPHLVGELIASEVEIKTGRCETFADVPAAMAERRSRLAALVEPLGLSLVELELEGVPTTRGLALDILRSEEFGSGVYSTSFLDEMEGRLPALAAAP